jgi:hypothetical protein
MARVIHWLSVFFTVIALALVSVATLLISSDQLAIGERQAGSPAVSAEPKLVMIGDYSEEEAAHSSLIDQLGREQLQSLRRKEAAAIRAYLNDFVLRR